MPGKRHKERSLAGAAGPVWSAEAESPRGRLGGHALGHLGCSTGTKAGPRSRAEGLPRFGCRPWVAHRRRQSHIPPCLCGPLAGGGVGVLLLQARRIRVGTSSAGTCPGILGPGDSPRQAGWNFGVARGRLPGPEQRGSPERGLPFLFSAFILLQATTRRRVGGHRLGGGPTTPDARCRVCCQQPGLGHAAGSCWGRCPRPGSTVEAVPSP